MCGWHSWRHLSGLWPICITPLRWCKPYSPLHAVKPSMEQISWDVKRMTMWSLAWDLYIRQPLCYVCSEPNMLYVWASITLYDASFIFMICSEMYTYTDIFNIWIYYYYYYYYCCCCCCCCCCCWASEQTLSGLNVWNTVYMFIYTIKLMYGFVCTYVSLVCCLLK